MTKLDRCWKNCLRMWKWVAANRKPGHVLSMKEEWLRVHRFKKKVRAYCFFCEYAGVTTLESGATFTNCDNCPGALVENRFSCMNTSYHFYDKPKAFYAKLLKLDAIRKK